MNNNYISFKLKLKEYLKFNIIGFSNFVISQLVYISLFSIFKINYIIAYTITSIFSVIASYFLNSKITFKQPRYCAIKLSLSIMVYILEYIINMSVIIFLVNRFNFSQIFAPIITPIVSTPIVFILMRYVIKKTNFKKESF